MYKRALGQYPTPGISGGWLFRSWRLSSASEGLVRILRVLSYIYHRTRRMRELRYASGIYTLSVVIEAIVSYKSLFTNRLHRDLAVFYLRYIYLKSNAMGSPLIPRGWKFAGCRLATRAWLRSFARHHPKLPLPFNPIGCEVRVIDRENNRKRFALRQIHERGVGEIHSSIHAPIPIAPHQAVHVRQFRIFDGAKNERSRTDELWVLGTGYWVLSPRFQP